ncbi:coatomer subunit epsilon-2 [Oryza brachyantha]|uniref:Coatomer subunit epsilon n=1 Tax=Oryza brachyantha TaxID=4533 RepID=J3M1Z1_ORYBR|nr:coatomer subunit epsilon-2 [Oryza brachyantha]
MAAAPDDHLFGLRNSFYVGAYKAVIAGAQAIPAQHALSPDDLAERDALLYRSYIAIGSHQLVIDEIGPSAATPLQAVRLLAVYLSGGAGDKESAIGKLNELLADDAVGSNPILRVVAGTVLMHERDYAGALKHTSSGGTMELLAMNVQICIQMHRPDHAEKQLRIMQQLDEDHTLTQLANAWVDLATGGSKIQEAHLIFQDLSEKYPATCMILNGKALCLMHMGSFQDAEGLLLESLNKDAKDAETLANLIVCTLNLGKSASRYLNQLKLAHPEHILVKRLSSAEDSFERACQAIS